MTQPPPALPRLATVGELRAFLGVRTARQLRWLLLATDNAGETLCPVGPARMASGATTTASTATTVAVPRPAPYRRHEIPKTDGSRRAIHAPCPLLKRVQRTILDEILGKVPVHPAAHGGVPGRSIVTNARPHVGKALVVRFDVKDFFPSTSYVRVAGLFRALGYPAAPDLGFAAADHSTRVAGTLARLCCYAPRLRAPWRVAHLPQGSPASPMVMNLLCRRLDSRLSGVARGLGAAYGRYVDDIAVSVPAALNPDKVRRRVNYVIRDEGFVPHKEKFKALRACRRQTVTGVVVNAHTTTSKLRRRTLRAVLHDVRLNGIEHAARGDPRFVTRLRGLASFCDMVETRRRHPSWRERVEQALTVAATMCRV